MFDHKYIAINQLTGIEVKRFRTLWGAKRWMAKPLSIMGLKISKSAMFIALYDIEDILEADVAEEVPNAFELMVSYAKEDALVTNAIYGKIMNINPGPVEPYEPEEFEDRCGKLDCLWCYGTQEEYEAGEFLKTDLDIVRGDEQSTLPGLEEPMPHWERELLSATGEYERCAQECEDCDNIVANRAAQAEALAESNAALVLLRKKLTGWTPEDDLVLITCDDYWDDPEHNTQTGQVDIESAGQGLFLVHYAETEDDNEEWTSFYQLTPFAVEQLGEFKPVVVVPPEGFNDDLVRQQAQEFYRGLAAGEGKPDTEEVDYKELMEEPPSSPKQD